MNFVHKFKIMVIIYNLQSQKSQSDFDVTRPMQGCPFPETRTKTSPPVWEGGGKEGRKRGRKGGGVRRGGE